MSSHNTLLVCMSGKVLREVEVSSVLLQYYQPTYLYIVYLERFYVRSEVIHKSPPADYCVGKSVLATWEGFA